MNFLTACRKSLAAVLVVAMASLSLPVVPVHAAMVGTDEVIDQSQGMPRDRVKSFLNRQDVKDQLRMLGIAPNEAEARVAALSDEEVNKIVGHIDEMPAGQGVGTIIGAAVLIFVILLITDLLGLTHVFGFTKKGSLKPS